MRIIPFIVICTLAALYCFLQFWFPKGVTLSFDYELQHPITFKVYYGRDADDQWTERDSVQYRAVGKQGRAEVFLPVSHLERVRIDPGSKPTHVVMRNVTLQGNETLTLGKEKGDFRALNISVWKVLQGEIRLASEHADPILEYDKSISLDAGGQREIRWFNFWLVLLTPGWLVYAICQLWEERKSSRASTRIPSLINVEFLRILFTVGVLIIHIRGGVYKLWSGGGQQGVEFFFLLSGYLLALTYKPERTLLDIAKRNWIRFAPLVVLGCLLCQGGFRSFLGLFMLQNTGLAFPYIPDLPAWYIGVLFWCSLFYLGLIKATSETNRYFIIGVLCFIVCMMVRVTPGDWSELYAGLVPRGLLRGIACMGIGGILAKSCKRDLSEPERASSVRWLYTIAEVGLIVYVVFSFFTKEYFIEYWIFRPITHVIILVLFIKKVGYFSSFVEHPGFAKLAKYCLSIYLTHWAFVHDQTWRLSDPTWGICYGMVLSCVVGVVAYYLIEKPFVKLLTPALTKKNDTAR